MLAYSQNEVIDISRDTIVQLRLIDRLIDLDTYHREIGNYISQLESNTDQYIEARTASEMVQSYDVDIATKENRIRELDRTLAHANFQKQKAWDWRAGLIKQIAETATQYGEVAKSVVRDEDAAQLPSLSKDDEDDPELKSYHGVVAQALGKLRAEIQGTIQVFEETMVTAESHRRRWQDNKDLWGQRVPNIPTGDWWRAGSPLNTEDKASSGSGRSEANAPSFCPKSRSVSTTCERV